MRNFFIENSLSLKVVNNFCTDDVDDVNTEALTSLSYDLCVNSDSMSFVTRIRTDAKV